MFRFQPRLEKRERKNWCSPVLKAQWTFEHLWEIHEETFRQEKNKLWHGNIMPSKKSNACGLARSASGGEEKVSITNTKPGVLFCKQLLQRQSRFTKANFSVIKGQSSAMVEWAFDLIWIIVWIGPQRQYLLQSKGLQEGRNLRSQKRTDCGD